MILIAETAILAKKLVFLLQRSVKTIFLNKNLRSRFYFIVHLL